MDLQIERRNVDKRLPKRSDRLTKAAYYCLISALARLNPSKQEIKPKKLECTFSSFRVSAEKQIILNLKLERFLKEPFRTCCVKPLYETPCITFTFMK